jgi:hypothetical protein
VYLSVYYRVREEENEEQNPVAGRRKPDLPVQMNRG